MKQLSLRFCATLSATYLTYSVGQIESINNVVSSCLCTLFLVLTSRIIMKNSSLESSIYLGSFLGMSTKILPLEFLALAMIAVFIQHLIDKKFEGYGGKLGSIAYVSGWILLFMKKVFI